MHPLVLCAWKKRWKKTLHLHHNHIAAAGLQQQHPQITDNGGASVCTSPSVPPAPHQQPTSSYTQEEEVAVVAEKLDELAGMGMVQGSSKQHTMAHNTSPTIFAYTVDENGDVPLVKKKKKKKGAFAEALVRRCALQRHLRRNLLFATQKPISCN